MGNLESDQWRVLDFTGFQGLIHTDRGALLLSKEDCEEIRVPVFDVSVVIVGINTSFTAGTLHRLLENDVSVIFCDWKAVPYGAVWSWAEHTRVGARHIAQMKASAPMRKNVWASLVKAKVLGQMAVLDLFHKSGGSRLKALSKEVKSGDTSNVEGQAAKLYWANLWEDTDFRRAPGMGSNDFSINSMLDYGYTVLRGHVMRAVAAAGLSPALGVFHHGRSNPWNLADDFIEPFRPAIDACVYRIVHQMDLSDREIKQELVHTAGGIYGNTHASIPLQMTRLAQHYGQFLEGDLDKVAITPWVPSEIEERRDAR